jgi:hypothetical protein
MILYHVVSGEYAQIRSRFDEQECVVHSWIDTEVLRGEGTSETEQLYIGIHDYSY